MNANLILVLDHGRIVQHGTHNDLANQPGIYREIYQLQARIEDELDQEIQEIVQIPGTFV
jgi:ABC-type transport system involved in cytochrome bd biosynthesis fused ATPase/permease subunit